MRRDSTSETLITYITSKSGHNSSKWQTKTVKTVSWICTLQAGRVTPFYKSKVVETQAAET